MSNNIIQYPHILTILTIIAISKCQFLDKNVLKAAGCLTLVKKLKDKPNDQRITTGLLLSCFINVDEETADKLLQNQYYEKMGIEESQVMQLIDLNALQKKYSPEQIEEYSKTLNAALEPLRDKGNKVEQSYNQYESYDQSNENDNKGLFDWIYKLFTSSDSLLLLFGLFIVFYFCLQKMRQWFGNGDKYSNNNTTSNKKTNKNNKNNKKKKK